MSYTLRGRLETRLAALVVPLAAACLVAAAVRAWWPVELAGAMVGVAVALDLAYHPLLPYQPGWAALPLGLLELGCVLAVLLGLAIDAPLLPALGLFAAGWLAGQLLGHALLPLWRLSYTEDGGELGLAGLAVATLVALPFATGAGLWYSSLPPVVRLSAGLHRGPLVIDRSEQLVGAPGTVVTGGIVVRHAGVKISNLRVAGGQYGVVVDGYRDVVLDHVTVTGAGLDGIHVRNTAVTIRDCSVDMRGARFGQGIDISFGMGAGESLVEGCRVVGGQQGILIDSAAATVRDNRVQRTTLRAISMDEMSMGTLVDNAVRDARGVGIFCNDHSMCMVSGNRVAGTRRDDAGGDRTRAGFGLLVDYGAEAEVGKNDLGRNPRPVGVFLPSAGTILRDE